MKTKNGGLDRAKVAEIRAKWAAKAATQPALAKEYGVSLDTISDVCRNRTWKDVPAAGEEPTLTPPPAAEPAKAKRRTRKTRTTETETEATTTEGTE